MFTKIKKILLLSIVGWSPSHSAQPTPPSTATPTPDAKGLNNIQPILDIINKSLKSFHTPTAADIQTAVANLRKTGQSDNDIKNALIAYEKTLDKGSVQYSGSLNIVDGIIRNLSNSTVTNSSTTSTVNPAMRPLPPIPTTPAPAPTEPTKPAPGEKQVTVIRSSGKKITYTVDSNNNLIQKNFDGSWTKTAPQDITQTLVNTLNKENLEFTIPDNPAALAPTTNTTTTPTTGTGSAATTTSEADAPTPEATAAGNAIRKAFKAALAAQKNAPTTQSQSNNESAAAKPAKGQLKSALKTNAPTTKKSVTFNPSNNTTLLIPNRSDLANLPATITAKPTQPATAESGTTGKPTLTYKASDKIKQMAAKQQAIVDAQIAAANTANTGAPTPAEAAAAPAAQPKKVPPLVAPKPSVMPTATPTGATQTTTPGNSGKPNNFADAMARASAARTAQNAANVAAAKAAGAQTRNSSNTSSLTPAQKAQIEVNKANLNARLNQGRLGAGEGIVNRPLVE